MLDKEFIKKNKEEKKKFIEDYIKNNYILKNMK
jgi:hypothetical protein